MIILDGLKCHVVSYFTCLSFFYSSFFYKFSDNKAVVVGRCELMLIRLWGFYDRVLHQFSNMKSHNFEVSETV